MGKHGEKFTSSDEQNIIKEDSKKKAEKSEKIESKELKQNKKRKETEPAKATSTMDVVPKPPIISTFLGLYNH